MHSPAKRASRSRSFSSIRALSIQWQDKVVNPVGSEGLSPCPFLLWPWRTNPLSGTFQLCWQMEVPKSAALESGPKFSHSLRSSEAAGQTGTKVVVVTSVMLSFISFLSFWCAAAIVLNDLGSSAFYVGGIAEQAVGNAPWFILAVMLFSYAVRAVYIESCGMFTRGGVYRVVKEAVGDTLAKLSVSAPTSLTSRSMTHPVRPLSTS